jgi:peptide/nickel transport system permease protein
MREFFNQIHSEPSAPRRNRLGDFLRIFTKNSLSVIGLLIFVVFFLTAISGLFLTSGQDPVFDPAIVRLQEKLLRPLSKPNTEILEPSEMPTAGIYILGTDDLGRDVFSRMLQGAWVSLTVGFVAVGISIFVGIFMGGISGYFGQNRITLGHIFVALLVSTGILISFLGLWFQGFLCLITAGAITMLYSRKKTDKKLLAGWTKFRDLNVMTVDTLIMRLVDIMLCFPSFFLILTVVALLPPSIYNIMIVIGLTSWMGTTRFVRAEFLSLREQDFVAAAKALGVGNFRIIFRHMIPNAIAPVLVSATIGIATAILTEAGLSFLGFGVPPPHATWGNILSNGKTFIFDAPWLTFAPGFAILIVVLSFNLFGEGLRDTLNPKLKERY